MLISETFNQTRFWQLELLRHGLWTLTFFEGIMDSHLIIIYGPRAEMFRFGLVAVLCNLGHGYDQQ